ncbi:hypothetical protein KQX54_014975 [Cotesia glomerata]|uniref:Uncharacterized protein n=1 Tax=Cotesia glomerata TaxID=32391 RepID=A0AAV7IGW7_COTGL|nr:hypothetical protein KQX54_014975 [Cotesia glomerata]
MKLCESVDVLVEFVCRANVCRRHRRTLVAPMKLSGPGQLVTSLSAAQSVIPTLANIPMNSGQISSQRLETEDVSINQPVTLTTIVFWDKKQNLRCKIAKGRRGIAWSAEAFSPSLTHTRAVFRILHVEGKLCPQTVVH